MDMPAIVYSAIGGLVVLAMIWFWRNVVPGIVQRFYHHEPTISGKWNTTFHEGDREYHETVTLSQKGRRVYGQIVLRLSDQADAVYVFEGTFRYLILTATYQSTDPAEYEQGVFALRYRKGAFVGQHVLVSKESDDLIPSSYTWTRE